MKKSVLSLLLILCLASIAYADDMYTSGSNNSGSRQDTFNINGNTPWLFLSIPQGNVKVSLFQWGSPANIFYMAPYEAGGNWYSFNSFIFTNNNTNYRCDDIKSLGNWNIELNYLKNNGT